MSNKSELNSLLSTEKLISIASVLFLLFLHEIKQKQKYYKFYLHK